MWVNEWGSERASVFKAEDNSDSVLCFSHVDSDRMNSDRTANKDLYLLIHLFGPHLMFWQSLFLNLDPELNDSARVAGHSVLEICLPHLPNAKIIGTHCSQCLVFYMSAWDPRLWCPHDKRFTGCHLSSHSMLNSLKLILLHCFIVCMYTCEGKRSTFRSWLSPCTVWIWVLGIKPWFSGLVTNIVTYWADSPVHGRHWQCDPWRLKHV